MSVITVDSTSPDPDVIARAAALLRAGRLVAFPTETVYGLGANALDPAAVERIYAAKGRPSYNPLIVHIANAADATQVASAWPERAELLARAFWPGPLTLVLPKRAEVPDAVTAGLPSVAVRVPAHPVAHALLAAAGIPVAAPSANRSMMLSPTTAAHVAKSLGDSVDLILDGGPTRVGIESTVVDLTTDTPTLLRPGMISRDDISRVIGPIAIASRLESDAARPSPGHARSTLFPARTTDRGVRARRRRRRSTRARARRACRRAGHRCVAQSAESSRECRQSAAEYAARLFESLHALDDAGCSVIVVERVPDDAAWDGVRDRLERAAASA